MKKNSLITVMLVILVAITLVGTVGVVAYLKFTDNKAVVNPSIDQIIASSVEVPELTTNLADNEFIRISFTIQANSKKAKAELEKRSFQVKNIIVLTLADKKSTDVQGKDGQQELQEELKSKINELMETGKVEKVYITNALLP